MKSKSLLLERKYHDSVAETYNHRRLQDYIWEVPEEVFLLHKPFFPPGSKVVDMVCGPAISVSRILGQSLLNSIFYTGVDLSRNLLNFAQKNIPNGKFVYHDMSSVTFPKSELDILLSFGALHHCEHKIKIPKRWLALIKPGGLMLLREPIYEFLKRGTGESPIEEGLKLEELLQFIHSYNIKVMRRTFFSTNAFRLCNRIMIKLGLGSWQRMRILWYPVLYVDALLAKLSTLHSIFKPQEFAIILQKR